MNVIETLVKDAETLIPKRKIFRRKNFAVVGNEENTWGFAVRDGKFDREWDEAFAEEEEVNESAVRENVEKCQAALMLLEKRICAFEFFEEDFAKEKALALQVGSRKS